MLPVSTCGAATIVLKSGEKIQAKIVERGDQFVREDFHGVTLTYWRAEIDHIDEDPLTVKMAEDVSRRLQSTAAADGPRPASRVEIVGAEQLAQLGATYYAKGKFDQAIELSEQALTQHPNDALKADILMNLSSDYLERGIHPYTQDKDDSDFQRAIAYAKQCVDLKPSYWQAWANLGAIAMNMNRLREADVYFTKAEQYADKQSPYYDQLTTKHALVKAAMEDNAAQSKEKKDGKQE